MKKYYIKGDPRPVYTVREHVKNLLAILESGDPCGKCPAAPGFNARRSPTAKYYSRRHTASYTVHNACIVCSIFVGLPGYSTYGPLCPCKRLGHEEAIKRTWLALERKGFLD